MAAEIEEKKLFEDFEEIIQSENPQLVRDFLDDQNISSVADLIYEFEDHETEIIDNMSIHRASSVFKILDSSVQERIIHALPPVKMAFLLNSLPADDRTDFLENLPSNTVRELIKLLDPEERKITLSLLGYPENSIGRLMTPDYVYVYPDNTIEDVFSTIRKFGKNSETIDVIYIINHNGELLDDIRIRDVILSPPSTKVSELMDERVIALNVHDDQEMASEVFKMNNRVALPVVSDSNKLLGIVTIDDILWVAEEEFSEDIQKMGGTAVLNEPYLDVSIFNLYKKRIIWLIILFIGETLTIVAMSNFQATLEQVLVLSTFIPLIISSGGNSGSQAATLIIQALALGEITVNDWWRIARREIISGFIMGTTLGAMGFLIVLGGHEIFHLFGEYYIRIGLAIGTAVVGVVMWGTIMGSMLPLLLKRLGADPATSSTPFVATLVDVTGLLIYFSVAFMLLSGSLL